MVPRHLTSNSLVGKTYAELIFAFMKDTIINGHAAEKIYILELGAGHGQLAFHILKHLERLKNHDPQTLSPYCYVLSDIVEENLKFFQNHTQFLPYFKKGILDVAYFDAISGNAIFLRQSGITIHPGDLTQPLLVIANYFFDSIPTDLFYIKNTKISTCSVTLNTAENPEGMDESALLKNMLYEFDTQLLKSPCYKESVLNDILKDYKDLVFDTYLFFPHKGIQCLTNLGKLSKKGLMVLSMDKGFHKIHELENAGVPEIITHGSFSIWVNFHAFSAYCKKQGGISFFPALSTFSAALGCLLLLPDSENYTQTKTAYKRFVDDFGPDDFDGIKKFTYKHIAKMNLSELISVLRLSAYDTTFFINVLPRIKQVAREVTFHDRRRLAETMHQTWNMYFYVNESEDLAYEMGGLFYDLGFYKDALKFFQFSINLYGYKADVFYNNALCYYQLREDALFLETIAAAKASFPGFEKFSHLDSLDLNAN